MNVKDLMNRLKHIVRNNPKYEITDEFGNLITLIELDDEYKQVILKTGKKYDT